MTHIHIYCLCWWGMQARLIMPISSHVHHVSTAGPSFWGKKWTHDTRCRLDVGLEKVATMAGGFMRLEAPSKDSMGWIKSLPVIDIAGQHLVKMSSLVRSLTRKNGDFPWQTVIPEGKYM